ncbi:MAG: hypothetical protein HY695_24205 [Deltaproteobacteria bacterium]|nr:hypothetical protein [Deltaproteobacteria bacterium]
MEPEIRRFHKVAEPTGSGDVKHKVRKNRRRARAELADEEKLSPQLRRELARRIADANNPVRYVVYSGLLRSGRWRLFLDVSGDGYWNTIDKATLFKRERVARAVAKVYSGGKRTDLLVAKITTKNGKRKVLEWKTGAQAPTSKRQPTMLKWKDARTRGGAQ